MIDVDKWAGYAKVVLWIMLIAIAATVIAHFVELAPLGETHAEIMEGIDDCRYCDASYRCSDCKNDYFEAKMVASQIAGVWKQTVINLFLIIAGTMLVLVAGEFSLIHDAARNKENPPTDNSNGAAEGTVQNNVSTVTSYKATTVQQDNPDENTCFCRKCGKRNVKTRNVCWSCGESLLGVNPKPQSWTCSCGRENASYVSTCACGMNKQDIR